MKKILSLILLLVFALLTFSSCKAKNKDKTPNNVEDEMTYTDIGLVYSDKAFQKQVETILFALSDAYEIPPIIMNDNSKEIENEVVFGMTSRPISEEAYRLLDRIEKESSSDVAYL
ncbi:MAG: hypothetical protein J6C39_04585, partial [Clostridia bacterium]|nr:hypothetical protein [Clostridia bacterium]